MGLKNEPKNMGSVPCFFYDKPEEAKGMGGIAVAGGMMMRCLSPWSENQKK
jgi:hypothetical protein